jgi:hypothetical protein
MAPFRPPPPIPFVQPPPLGLGKVHGLALGFVAFGGLLLMTGLTFAALAIFLASRATRDPGVPLALFVTEGVMMTSIATVFGVAALSLFRQRNPTSVRVAAGLACVLFPLGTVLGVLTFRWLDREDVRSLFEANARPRAR